MSHKVQYITRTQAAKLIEELREIAAGDKPLSARHIADRLALYGIDPLVPCSAQAHQPGGGYIDNCMCCAPRWGFTGSTLKVR